MDRQTNRQAERQMDEKTDKWMDRQWADGKMDRYTIDKLTNGQTDKWTDRQIGILKDWKKKCTNKQIDRPTNG